MRALALTRVCIHALGLLLVYPLLFAQSESCIPPEVRYKSGYVNPVSRPKEFRSAMLWGIAIADTRVAGYEKARVEIRRMFSCRVNGKGIE